MTEPSKDLVIQSTAYSRASLEERQRYVGALAKAGDLLPPNYRGGMVRNPDTNQMVQMGSAGKIMLMAETGDMLGIHPMAALVGVHIIEGKPSLSANLMNGLVRKAGHILRVRVTGSIEDETLQATATLIRHDDPDFPFEVTWTLADAKRAGLWPGKESSNWRKYPRAMLKSRVISEIIREGAADVLMGGNVYTPEELGAQVNEQGEPIELKAEPAAPAAPKQQAPIVDPQPEPTTPAEEVAEAAVLDEAMQGGPAGDEASDQLGANEEYAEEVTDEPKPSDEEESWVKRLEDVTDSEGAKAMYREARERGLLAQTIAWGDARVTLEAAITAVGSAMVQLEKSKEAE